MAIYRGPGGSGDAVNDSSSETRLAVEARDAAIAAQAAAEAAQSAAETAEANAETAETNAETAETNAETAATNAASSASSASSSASSASSSASAAATSASNASTSASSASTSATNASNSASAASTSATNASNSATAAATSATNASNSASAASTSATNAANSATAAQTAETNAETAETNAETAQAAAELAETNAETAASNAATSETNAASSASAASTSASNAATSATNASNSASAASTSASNASTSATAAQSAQTAAEAARDAALSAYDNFDDRYLGPKSSDPTLDNDGNALLTGALYFNTATNVMKVYDGSVWVAAYVSAAGVLLAANNLSDLTSVSTARTNLGVTATGSDTTYAYRSNNLSDLSSASTARTNLGLGTAATTASTDYATAAQGSKADTALQPATIGVTVQGYDADLAAFALKTAPTGAVVGTSDTQTLTNKTIALGSNTVSGTLAEFNTAVTDADFASIAGTETLTNKTLTSPVISGGSINNATVGASTASTGAFTSLSASGAFSANGGATLGDASGDALTINSSAVSIPNGLNFDSNTLVVDATNDRVAIGTNTPFGRFRVSAGDGTQIGFNGATRGVRFEFNSTGTTINGVDNTFNTSYQPLTVGGSDVRFSTSDTERMRITSAGNVCIGTTTAGASAAVLTFADTNALKIGLNGGAANYYGISKLSGGGSLGDGEFRFTAGDTSAGAFTFSGAGTERMRITSAGAVGIGTSSPTDKLTAFGSNPSIGISGGLGSSGSPANTDVSFRGYLGNRTALIRSFDQSSSTSDSGGLLFFTNANMAADSPTERVRITSSGNVGIGTSSPSAKLSIAGSTASDYTTGMTFSKSGGNTYAIAPDANDLFVRSVTAGIEVCRFTYGGNLQFNSGYGSVATAYGCRAWVNFNGTGTVAIRGSGNVSSITDNSTGNYTVNFTTAMPDINYVVVGMGMQNRSIDYPTSTFSSHQFTGSVNIRNRDLGGGAQDEQCINIVVFR